MVKNKTIAAVGNLSNKKADKIIDALGAMAAPGFIDVNTDSDHYLGLFSEPHQKDFIRQGVTTIIGGNCGSSLAPALTGSLRSIRKWADVNIINLDWHTVEEFLKILEERKLGVNFGTLVGHSTIRRALVGESDRNLTEKEIASLKSILKEALRAGAFGFSTGLGYIHSRNVPYNEIKALVETTAELKKVYATHLRSESSGLLAAVNETLSLAKDTGANVEISHFRPLIGFKGEYEKALEIIDANAAAVNINFDLYPFETSIVPIYTLLPEWAQGSLEKMLENIFQNETKEKILKELPAIKPEDYLIAKTPTSYKFLAGKTLKQFSENRQLNPKDGLLELMKLTNLGIIFFHKNINLDAVINTLSNPRTIIASNGAALPDEYFKHERYYNTFPKFLKLAKEQNLMPMETAVAKITSLPAKKYGIKERGLLVEGYYADIVIIRNEKPTDVVINGEVAMESGELKKTLTGMVLKSK